jgi:transcriptional regulator with XRE-family HTH domain
MKNPKIEYNPEAIPNLMFGVGLSQAEFADHAGINRQLVHNYVKKKHRPSVEKLADLCNVYGVDPNFFFKEVKEVK